MTQAITAKECASMRLLAADGWAVGELAMCFHLSRGQDVRRHVLGECSHETEVQAVADSWDGQTAPHVDNTKGRVA